MDSPTSGTSRGKRGRRRDEQEVVLTEDEEKRRQKNRDAAKKCRQNKLKEVEDLKRNNENLEAQNSDLLKKKTFLEEKVQQLLEFIQDHMAKGCQLPPHQEELWKQNYKDFSEMISLDQAGLSCEVSRNNSARSVQPSFREVNKTVMNVTTPQYNYTSASSPSFNSDSSNTSPVTLFSGQPLSAEQIVHRPPSSRRSSTSSPTSPKSPATPQSITINYPSHSSLGGNYLVNSDTVSSSSPLAPIRHASHIGASYRCHPYNKTPPHVESQVSTDSSASIPLVVLEEEGMDDTDQGLGQTKTLQISDVLRQAREEPDMEVESSVPQFESSLPTTIVENNTTSNWEATNLGSGGFVFKRDGSTPTSPQTSKSFPLEGSFFSKNGNEKQKLQKHKRTTEAVHLNVTAPELMAPAILGMQDSEMSSTLKKQIHSSWSSSSPSSGSPSDTTINNDVVSPSVNANGNVGNGCVQEQSNEEYHSSAQLVEMQNVSPSQPPQSPQAPASMSSLNVQPHQAAPRFQSIRYVQKKGHHFVLDELPNGKHRVYEIKDNNELVDTQYEIQLRDYNPSQPATSYQTSAEPATHQTPVVQVVPQVNDSTSVQTTQHQHEDETGPRVVVENISSGNTLPSLNLPSLTFNDFTREDIDVYSKEPKGKSAS